MSKMRTVVGALLFLLGSGCTGGINAGKQGGVAFIALTVMLILGVAIMWFAMGRDE